MKKSEEMKRKQLTLIIEKVLETNIELMTYYHSIATDSKSKRVCNKSIKQSRKAIEKLHYIKHLEILVSLYNTIVAGKETIFVIGGSLICSKNFDRWDKTEKGFKEFLELEKQAKEEQKRVVEEKQRDMETIKKAKEQGKQVEMIYDNGKLRPVVKENTNIN